MTLRDLVFLYGVAGLACAVAVLRKETGGGARAVWSAVATVPLWPLWAPFVLSTPRPLHRSGGARPRMRTSDTTACPPGARPGGALARIEHALDEAVKAVAGTPMSQMFSRQVAQRIAAQVAVVAERMNELDAIEFSHGLGRAASGRRLEELLATNATERTIASARLTHESLLRLEELRAADALALEELADLLEALRAQLLLARYAGSPSDGTGAIVSEVWARLEGLGAAFETPAA